MKTIPHASGAPLSSSIESAVSSGANAAADFANHKLEAAHDRVENLRTQIPEKVESAAARIEHLAHASIERARNASVKVRQQAVRAYDGTTTYVREEPVKAVLIAAAAGALLIGAIGMVRRMRTPHQ